MYGEIHICLVSSAFLLFKRLGKSRRDAQITRIDHPLASCGLKPHTCESTRNKLDQARVILVTVVGLIKGEIKPISILKRLRFQFPASIV